MWHSLQLECVKATNGHEEFDLVVVEAKPTPLWPLTHKVVKDRRYQHTHYEILSCDYFFLFLLSNVS